MDDFIRVLSPAAKMTAKHVRFIHFLPLWWQPALKTGAILPAT